MTMSVIHPGTLVHPDGMLGARYPQSLSCKASLRGPSILEGAIVGAASALLPGNTVSHRALVWTGAVFVTDVPDFKVLASNPAEVINDVRDLPKGTAFGETYA